LKLPGKFRGQHATFIDVAGLPGRETLEKNIYSFVAALL